MNDLKCAICQLPKNTGFTGVTVRTLALGKGAGTSKAALKRKIVF